MLGFRNTKMSAQNKMLMDKSFPGSTSNVEKYGRLLELISSDDVVAIFISVDPDAVASALALRRILWRRVKKTIVTHVNPIKRADNLALIRLLKVELKKLKDVDRSEISKWAIVDSQPHHAEECSDIDFNIVIDHHRIGEGLTAEFIDIQEDYGAVSTMMTEYLKAGDIKPSPRLATALFLGIKNDTQNFVRTTISNDLNAFRYLYRFANMNVVKKIEASEMTRSTLKSFQKAMERVKIIRDIAYVDMGKVPDSDTLVIIADFFLKLAEVSWTFVSGRIREDLVIIIRNVGFKRDAGKAAKELFGKWGSAGGRQNAARVTISLKDPEEEIDLSNDSKFILGRIQDSWHRE